MDTIPILFLVAMGVAGFGFIWASRRFMKELSKCFNSVTNCIEDLEELNRKERLK